MNGTLFEWKTRPEEARIKNCQRLVALAEKDPSAPVIGWEEAYSYYDGTARLGWEQERWLNARAKDLGMTFSPAPSTRPSRPMRWGYRVGKLGAVMLALGAIGTAVPSHFFPFSVVPASTWLGLAEACLVFFLLTLVGAALDL
ncbi:MAG: hypothetical protein KGI89_03075 [Euryarchaeota archaeon]|nr:hypothetical protein [Euryarchaeota archaeon]